MLNYYSTLLTSCKKWTSVQCLKKKKNCCYCRFISLSRWLILTLIFFTARRSTLWNNNNNIDISFKYRWGKLNSPTQVHDDLRCYFYLKCQVTSFIFHTEKKYHNTARTRVLRSLENKAFYWMVYIHTHTHILEDNIRFEEFFFLCGVVLENCYKNLGVLEIRKLPLLQQIQAYEVVLFNK